MILLSKATQKEIATLIEKAKNENLLLEMRDRHGLLLGLSHNLHNLQEMKDQKGKNLYRVDSKEVVNYDKSFIFVSWDIELGIYEGKKFFSHKYQEKFDKQEAYWANYAQKKYSFNLKNI